VSKENGFTLLEILVALFVFTIVSLILSSTLHNMINFQASTEANAERLRQLQLTLLLMSRDIEQTINRSVGNAGGGEENAFIGSAHSFSFTHAGFANPTGALSRSGLQRTQYTWEDHALWRMTWQALDQAPNSLMQSRSLMGKITDAHFEYLDNAGHFHTLWPLTGETDQPLPRAIRVFLTIAQWGTLSQLYVIPIQTKAKTTEKNT